PVRWMIRQRARARDEEPQVLEHRAAFRAFREMLLHLPFPGGWKLTIQVVGNEIGPDVIHSVTPISGSGAGAGSSGPDAAGPWSAHPSPPGAPRSPGA